MRALEQAAVDAGATWAGLMEHAGWGVAQAAMQILGDAAGKRVLVLVGPGNNGGDGFVAAAELSAQGRDVAVVLMCEREALTGDAASAARGWKPPGSGTTGTRSRRARSASGPPVVATTIAAPTVRASS